MKKKMIACFLMALPLLANNILVFAGSTRTESYNKKLAQKAAEMARQSGAEVTLIDLKDYPMPFYDADLETKTGMPKNAKRLRDAMLASDAMIIASPEYNASIPAVLKNAIDWASRAPEGGSSQEAFKGKKIAIMSASPGRGGGARGLVHLRSILEDVGGEVVDLQVVIPRAFEQGAFDREEVTFGLKDELRLIAPGRCT
jgi:NAD(P)H-dependent FMN reductase